MDFAQTLAQFNPDARVRAWVSQQFEIVQHRLTEQDAKLQTQETKLQTQDAELRHAALKNQALILELAHLRRMRFGQSSEAINERHGNLFDEALGSDIGALEAEIEQSASASAAASANVATTATPTPAPKRSGAGRQRLPEHLPRIVHRHDLPQSACSCAACGSSLTVIGEDVSEQLDVTPAAFFVHQHIRPQYACKSCETVTAAPVPALVIDGGMAAPGLIAWLLVAKFADHLPLYRLEQIAARSQVNLSRSTLAEWVGRYGVALTPLVDRLRELLKARAVLHADETPVEQLLPGNGKTKRAYLWAYCSSELGELGGDADENASPAPIVIFDYQTSRAGVHARSFLAGWRGHLMCDDYVGYKALFTTSATSAAEANLIELGCMAHARRKFFELHAANGSGVALEALTRIAALYAIEARSKALSVDERRRIRVQEAVPQLTEMKRWLTQTRINTANGGALAKAIDYSLKRWDALSRYAHSGHLPIDNNASENAIRPIAIGKKNWLFAGSERAGKRAAQIQSLIATANRNGLDPFAWLKDVIEKLPTHPNRRIDELLPFNGYRFG